MAELGLRFAPARDVRRRMRLETRCPNCIPPVPVPKRVDQSTEDSEPEHISPQTSLDRYHIPRRPFRSPNNTHPSSSTNPFALPNKALNLVLRVTKIVSLPNPGRWVSVLRAPVPWSTLIGSVGSAGPLRAGGTGAGGRSWVRGGRGWEGWGPRGREGPASALSIAGVGDEEMRRRGRGRGGPVKRGDKRRDARSCAG